MDPSGDGGVGLTATGLSCASCGADLPLNSKFCNECGAPVTPVRRSAEYKQVTELFADVVHSMDIAAAVGAERLREIMAELLDRSAAVVKRLGGTVDKFTGDGIMAVFGAPAALEDHAIRACLAALAIQDEAAQLAIEIQDRDGVELQLRIGLNSGQVIAGEIGSGSSGYTAIGEQVGMAQRMESVAPPGAVMLSASTARLVDGAAALGEPEMVRIKGADEPVRAHRLLGIGDRHRAVGRGESTLVGRRWEMSAVEGLLDCAVDGHGAVLGVVGSLASVRAVWCARWRRWRVDEAWRCSRPSASRTPARSPSMPSHGCCAWPPASRVLTGRRLAIECATAFPTEIPRTCCSLMTCWASPTRVQNPLLHFDLAWVRVQA